MSTHECLSCEHIEHCSETNVRRLLDGYLCGLYKEVADPVVVARYEMIFRYGPKPAAFALLKREPDPTNKEECQTMGPWDPPAPGTTYSERKKQLEVMTFMDVRVLGAKKYVNAEGQPVLDWDESRRQDRKNDSITKVLDFELSNGFIVPDGGAVQTPQLEGTSQMANNPYQPGNGAVPPGVPGIPQQVAPPAPNMQPPVPQIPAGVSPPTMPYGMAPQVPPGATPPVQPPQQEAAPTGKKKGKGASAGAAAAPPPPPPPSNPQPGQQFMTASPQPPAPPPGFQAQQPQQFSPPPVPGTPNWGAPAPVMTAPPVPAAQQAAPVGGAPVDLGQVLQLIDSVGKAVNAIGQAQDTRAAALDQALEKISNLLLVQVAAIHHIYLSTPPLGQALQQSGKTLADVNQFITYMQQYLPPR